jgi:hypothetical protein
VICFPSNDFHGEETNGRDVGVSWLLQVFSCLSEAQACVCLVQIPATVSQDFIAKHYAEGFKVMQTTEVTTAVSVCLQLSACR